MYYSYHKKFYPDNILVIIEEFNPQNRTVLFDFIDSNEYSIFTNRIEREYDLNKPSMVLLKNYNRRRIQENTIYSVKPEIIDVWKNQISESSENLDSFLIGYIIDVLEAKEEIFSMSVSINEFNLFLNSSMAGGIDIKNFYFDYLGKLSVIIRNVGQGNWNEITVNDEVKIVYDIGASMYASRMEVLQIIGNRNFIYDKTKPILILSHWDKDHYHLLLGMSETELQNNFSTFICRDHVPNLTSRILYSRLRAAIGIKNILSIQANLRNKRGGPTYFTNITPRDKQIVIYNSQYHKNRNISGLILVIKSSRKSVILSGDAHYEQISRDILPHLNYIHKHSLVVPHHGGKAGIYKYTTPPLMIVENAIISVGINHYRHPNANYISSLKADKFSIQQTNIARQDIIVDL